MHIQRIETATLNRAMDSGFFPWKQGELLIGMFSNSIHFNVPEWLRPGEVYFIVQCPASSISDLPWNTMEAVAFSVVMDALEKTLPFMRAAEYAQHDVARDGEISDSEYWDL